MSTRTSSRKKVATSRTQDLDTPRSRRAKQPKYSNADDGCDGLSSRGSSPGSRPVTPAQARRGRPVGSKSSTVSKLKKQKRGRPSGTSTPASRQSRASSVSSTAKSAAATSHKKGRGKGRPKTKTASSTSFKETDYHYGSDFEGNIYEEEDDSDSSSDSDLSDIDSFSDDMKPESDVELEPNLIDDDESDWMDLDPANVTKLELPESSDDLLLLPDQAFEAITIYEVLRHYYKILRLSPFRFEDFCAMLASQDQSNLTSEVHTCLLKALLREDDAQQAQYGPLDQKDSMNVFVNFVDPVTWPENLRFYLSTEPDVYKDGLQVISSCEYPFTTAENRLKILKILTDALLNTSAVRDDLLNEGSTPAEDHCRVCGKLGDMVICEHCNGPFHGTCLEPPMYEVPEDDWICPVCAENMIDGVYDCLSTNPGSCRIQPLGTDRHGSRFWFASRRVWVCSVVEGEEPKYYSTKAQLTELLESIDKDKYEKDLYENIIEAQEEMEKQMEVTEELTKKLNSKGLKSYLDTNNMVLDKLQQERNDLREFLEAEERKVQMDIDRQIREEEEERMRKQKEQERKEKEEKLAQLRKEREDRLKRRKGETNENGEAIVPPKDETAPDTEPEKVEKDGKEVEEEIEALEAEIKEDTLQLEQQETDPKQETNAQQLKRVENYKGPRNMKDIKRGEMPPGPYYRLGEEYTYLVYVNQYSIHSHALSKSQNKEDSEKRSRMSHKFSLTEVCGFKWSGQPQGQRNTLVSTVRNTILSLENNIPTAFMHTNWPLLRKPWIQAVSTCTDANKDFSRALTVLSGCIKPCVMLPVWNDALGHTSIKKVGYQGKEEKKRQEKREKKEREEEEERLKPYMTWVKYTLPVRSLAVVRQKGEEYRAHGRNGWLWLSATRSFRPRPSAQLGLKAGPFRIAANYTEIKTGISKVVLMEPKALAFLLEVQRERDNIQNGTNGKEENDKNKTSGDAKVIEVEKQEEDKKRANLTKVLDVSRIDLMEPKEKDLGGPDGVVDVCHGMSQPNRLLYPRCAKKTKVDDLLARRLHLKALEEKRLNPLSSKEETDSSLLSLEKWIQDSQEKLSAQVDAICSLQTSQLTCYSPMCQSNPLLSACYSPSCRKHIQTVKLAVAADVYNKVMAESRKRAVKGLPGTTDIKFTYTTTALSALNNLISLVKAKEEEINYESALQSLSTTAQATKENITKSESVINNEIKTEQEDESKADTKPNINKRIFSDPDTSKPIKLEQVGMGESKQNRIVKYPLAPTFWSKMHSKRNILINSNHELHRLARQAGMVVIEGFNYNSKANASAWPYPCPRPTFKTAWLFRTASMNSLHSVALQMRILWACIRWDDMNTKPANPDGKHSETTDTEIVTTELLKHRNIGRYLEKTQYFQRRVTIPLDAPRKQVDYSPIRSGLRKRKRAESPVQAEPQVAEKWIDEHDLELCDIRAYRDKLERGNDVPITRTNNGRNIKAPERYDPSDLHEVKKRNSTSSDMKAKFDAQIKEQREAFKASRSTTPDLPNTKPSLSGIRRESNIKMAPGPAHTTYTTSIPGVGGAKKVFLTKDGKIVGHQLIGGHAAAGMNNKMEIAPLNKTTISTTKPTPPPPVAQPTPTTPGQQQKVQIVKTSDGKIQVRGLMPGQQLVQMPDGKLQIFSLPSTNAATTTTQQQPQAVGGSIGGVRLATPSTPSSPAGTIRLVSSPSTQPQTLQQQPQPQLIQPAPTAVGIQRPATMITSTASPLQVTNAVRPQIVSIVRPPGGNIAGVTPIQPKPVTGIMPLSGTVTTPGGTGQPRLQLIQNGSVTPIQQTVRPIMAQPQPQLIKNTPGVIQSIGTVNNSSNAPTTATPTVANISSPNKGGQLVGIQSLGQNTITVKDGQLIVQGPDHEAATNIARHLASGQAKLAHINGKQVLLITNPSQVQQQQQQVVSGGQRMAVQQQQPQQSVLSSPQKLLSQATQQQTPQQQSVQPQQPGLVQQQQPQQPAPVPQQQQGLVRQSVTVSANLVQTEQGPRIILQGLQGVNLSQEHLANIQQQVKTQLLKQQALARQQQKPPPTKIFIELLLTNGGGQPMLKSPTVEPPQMLPVTPGSAAQLVTSQNQLITSPTAVASHQQLLSSNQMVSQQQVINSLAGQTLVNTLTPSPAKQQVSTLPGSSSQHSSVPTPMLNQDHQPLADKQPPQPVSLPQQPHPQPPPPQSQPVPLNTLPDHILKQGRYITKDGKRMLVLPQQVMQQYQQSLKQQQSQQQQQSAVGGLGTGTSTALPSTTTQSPSTESLNLLSPGSEAKLMSSTKLFSPSKLDDDKFELTDDYIQQTIKEALESGNLTPDLQEKLMSQLNQQQDEIKNKTNSNKKGKKKSDLFDPLTGERLDDEWEPGSWSSKAKINNQIRKEKVAPAATQDDFTTTQVSPKVPASTVAKQPLIQNQPQNPQQMQKRKFTMYTTPRLNTMLFKHKEQLKKEIAKKRAVLEKDLMQDIQREIDSLKQQAALKLGTEFMSSNNKPQQDQGGSDSEITNGRKRKLDASPNLPTQPPGKKRPKAEKNERLYCICKTKLDPSKFYVGCDLCRNWFHGSCVGITQKMSKKMTEYICKECEHAKLGTETYCMCKQPYDEARFYIGCERCPDWLHGRCVGILQVEAEGIQDYECPKCNPKSALNLANLKQLKRQDLDVIKKLFKQIQNSKHSVPFKKPMEKRTNKKYYELVKEPMDLETMDKKLERDEYKTLAEFLGDLTRITENCRYFYPLESANSKHAEQLELFILDKLGTIRQKLLESK